MDDFIERISRPYPTASTLLNAASDILSERAVMRDTPEGERSVQRAVEAFNILTGHSLTTTDGWQFLLLLKQSRAGTGRFHADDWIDMIGYAALAAEAAHMQHHEESEGGE